MVFIFVGPSRCKLVYSKLVFLDMGIKTTLCDRHSMSHTGAKPYICEECGNAYADKKRLRDHQMAHTGTLPHSCDFCGFSCRRKDHLRAHVRRLHPELTSDSQGKPMAVAVTAGTAGRKAAKGKARQLLPGVGDSGRSHIVGHINQDGSIRPVTTPAERPEGGGGGPLPQDLAPPPPPKSAV